ncbi:terminase small subunit [Microbacterium phage Sharkboy]|uniref:Terminase small subunit n=3 Tax=Dismasvirus dismas TaxID=2560588 RepID=A0A516KU76_9CAUD|nr:terminase small subunit [Microbacterium phage Dismas]AVR57166.1 terminase small subunit [Microbacterium phage Kieran]QDP45238.1 terminase small subunit [Microbacterium phage Sharkboy]UYL86790.1 terminase small subunit [Microbacterium phage Rona]WNM67323.1 terminase small subunit [Microbacterium phage ChiliPepper]AUG84799.1 terminase small subunit [Microbacterium phage Dismas]
MGKLLEAFDKSVAQSANGQLIAELDDAIVQTGRSIAQSIDDIMADPEASATDKTKALYLAPHLVAILRELLATPAARKQMGLATADTKKASRLQLMKDAAKKAQQPGG